MVFILFAFRFSAHGALPAAAGCWIKLQVWGAKVDGFHFFILFRLFYPFTHGGSGPALALFPRRPFLCPPSLLLSPQLRLRFKPRCASRCHHILAGALPAVRALKRHSHAHTEETKKDDTNMCARKAINSFNLSNLPLLPRILSQAATAGFINGS